MAEAALIGAAKSVLPQLGDLALKEAIACWSARGDLEDLGETMEMIEAVLRDAEEQQDTNHAVKLWLQRLRRALYEADDLFDEVLAHDQSRKLMGTLNKVRGLFSSSNPVYMRWNVAGKIRSIREKLDKVTADMERFKFRKDQPTSAIYGGLQLGSRDETSPHVVEVDIVGREYDKQNILKMLSGVGESGEIPEVVAIVGIGGSGKTTLAQLLYNDNIVSEKFEVKAWACVYDETNCKKVIEGKILKSIFQSCKVQPDGKPELEACFIRSIYSEKYDELDINKIRTSIGEQLEGKKYLLVLDDIRDDNRDYWVDLFGFLRKGKRESKILGTMRSKGVAESMGVHTSKLHILEGLETKEAKRLQVLKFSYDHLPSHLKRCFGYCALFPKDHEFDKDLLIRLWIAQGFVQLRIAYHESLEDVGYKYFNELLNMSFFLVEQLGQYGLCHKMHDIMHDLALYVAGEEVDVIIDRDENMQLNSDLRHVSFNLVSPNLLEIGVARQVRSLFISDTKNFSPECVEVVCVNFVSLRVLDLHELGIVHVPDSIGELIHLRYLDLSKNKEIEYLPNSVTRLINLQTLNLSDCGSLKRLPKRFGRLINLRHLNLFECHSLSYMPRDFGRLTSLQTFEGVFVVNAPSGLDILSGLTFHTKSLEVRCVNPMGRGARDRDSNLNNDTIGTHIKVNDLCITFLCEDQPAQLEMMYFLQRMKIQNLEKLEIEDYEGQRFPGWGRVDGSMNMTMTIPPLFNNLIKIRLFSCESCKILPSFSRLPHLKVLSLSFVNSLEYIEEEYEYPSSIMSSTPPLSFFPSLEKLTLYDLPKLKGWFRFSNSHSSPRIRDLEAQHAFTLPSFPSVSVLYIKYCPCLTTIPPLLPNVVQKVEVIDGPTSLRMQLLNTIASPIAITSSTDCSDQSLCRLVATPECFEIRGFENLSSLSFVEGASKCVTKLRIEGCPELCLLEGLEYLTSLQELQIGNCVALNLWEDSSSSTTLTLWQLLSNNCKNLRVLSFHGPSKRCTLPSGIQLLTTLQELELKSLRHLKALPVWIGNLIHLQKLHIENCPQLSHRGLEFITSLQQLRTDCDTLDLWEEEYKVKSLTDWQYLSDNCKSLRVFQVAGYGRQSLPWGLQFLTNLQELEIKYCHNINAIPEWIGNLTHLQKLTISNCYKLTCLPKSMLSLTDLQYFEIDYSGSAIVDKCKETTGEYWPLIQHIPNIKICDGISGLLQQRHPVHCNSVSWSKPLSKISCFCVG